MTVQVQYLRTNVEEALRQCMNSNSMVSTRPSFLSTHCRTPYCISSHTHLIPYHETSQPTSLHFSTLFIPLNPSSPLLTPLTPLNPRNLSYHPNLIPLYPQDHSANVTKVLLADHPEMVANESLIVQQALAFTHGPLKLCLSHDLTALLGTAPISNHIRSVFWASLKKTHISIIRSFEDIFQIRSGITTFRYRPVFMFVFESIMSILYLYLVASVAANPNPNASSNPLSASSTNLSGGISECFHNASTRGGGDVIGGYRSPALVCPLPAPGQGLESALTIGLSGKEMFIVVSSI